MTLPTSISSVHILVPRKKLFNDRLRANNVAVLCVYHVSRCSAEGRLARTKIVAAMGFSI